MDIKQDSTETDNKPERKLPDVTLPKFYMPKIKPKEWPNKLKLKIREYGRVLKITKKPTSTEFKAIVKASGLGIIIIGMIGFTIHMIVQLLHMR